MQSKFLATVWRRIFQLALALPLLSARLLAADSFPELSQLPSRPALPDPLVMSNGQKVTTREQWLQQRRPELKALFQHYMYGTMPPTPKATHFQLERVDKNFFSGKATKKEVTISLGRATNSPRIQLLLLIPNAAPKNSAAVPSAPKQKPRACPLFVGVNFCGNHALVTDTNVALPGTWMPKNCPGCVDNRATDAGRGSQVDSWALEQSIDRGYAVATFYYGDVEPDRPDATEGIRACLELTNDTGAIAAWAWGISRAVDYLVTDKDIDARRIAVVGHSRNGKAAALAAAFDDRIALAIPLQAGCGGTSPSRGKSGESVKVINEKFPHWFNSEFKKFGDEPARLPFDQNCLIALIAPRPVLLSCATEDTWSNPAGQFEVLQAADSVYRFLGVGGLEAKQMPETNKLAISRLTYYIRPGKHSMTRDDWKVFLDFADKQMP
jgi:dienelactone hydrolase